MSFEYQMYLAYAALVLLAGYGLYWFLIPKPLPGIPYSQSSIRFLGDIPAATKSIAETQTTSIFIEERAHELQSSIFQVMLDPLDKPWIILTDPLVIEDLLTHRIAEFEQSPLFSDLFGAIVPNSMMNMKTKDPRWKLHRRLMADTMTNNFLHGVAGEHILASAQDTVQLWLKKSSLGNARPFEASSDVADMLMESTWGSAFGEALGMTRATMQALLNTKEFPEVDQDMPVTFPSRPYSVTYGSIYALADSTEIPRKHPLRLIAHHAALIFSSRLRQANSYRKKYIGARLDDAWARFSSGTTEVKSAADLLVEKEVFLANKEQRPARYDSSDVRDELYTFVLGGYDTSSTTTQWALKLLTKHQRVQQKLRSDLQTAFPQNATPALQELVYADLPYLDAVIHEVLRAGCTASFVSRQAQVDTQIQGYPVPKGTQVMCLLTGPGYRESTVGKAYDQKDPYRPGWNSDDLKHFKPERWLVEENGKVKFDARALPMHQFGVGKRSCFGKRLALLGMRIILTTIVLNLELQPIPEVLEDFGAKEIITRSPQNVYIRPVKV